MASIIGVETLQHTNGTTAATIDSSGRMATPARPAFFATCTSSNNQTSGTINYDSETFDIGGNYNPTTQQFTAPVDGIYQFSFTYYAVVTDRARVSLTKNGSTIITRGGRAIRPSGEEPATSENTLICQLSANDTVEVKWEEGNVHTNAGYNYFCGHLIG